MIVVPLLGPLPDGHQQENWRIDPNFRWKKATTFKWRGLNEMAETGGGLWRNGYSSSNGRNDRIPLQEANEEAGSLKLVRVDRLRLRVLPPHGVSKKKSVRVRFHFADSCYDLSVTDPLFKDTWPAKPNRDYLLKEEIYLTISLGKPYKGYCYKLVAAVIRRRGG